jgi:hypothetical protein
VHSTSHSEHEPNPFITLTAAAQQLAQQEAAVFEEDRQRGADPHLNNEDDDDETEQFEESAILNQLRQMQPLPATNACLLLTNYTFSELMGLWSTVVDVMTEAWRGKGRKSIITAFDAFFILLNHIKTGDSPPDLTQRFERFYEPVDLKEEVVCLNP